MEKKLNKLKFYIKIFQPDKNSLDTITTQKLDYLKQYLDYAINNNLTPSKDEKQIITDLTDEYDITIYFVITFIFLLILIGSIINKFISIDFFLSPLWGIMFFAVIYPLIITLNILLTDKINNLTFKIESYPIPCLDFDLKNYFEKSIKSIKTKLKTNVSASLTKYAEIINNPGFVLNSDDRNLIMEIKQNTREINKNLISVFIAGLIVLTIFIAVDLDAYILGTIVFLFGYYFAGILFLKHYFVIEIQKQYSKYKARIEEVNNSGHNQNDICCGFSSNVKENYREIISFLMKKEETIIINSDQKFEVYLYLREFRKYLENPDNNTDSPYSDIEKSLIEFLSKSMKLEKIFYYLEFFILPLFILFCLNIYNSFYIWSPRLVLMLMTAINIFFIINRSANILFYRNFLNTVKSLNLPVFNLNDPDFVTKNKIEDFLFRSEAFGSKFKNIAGRFKAYISTINNFESGLNETDKNIINEFKKLCAKVQNIDKKITQGGSIILIILNFLLCFAVYFDYQANLAAIIFISYLVILSIVMWSFKESIYKEFVRIDKKYLLRIMEVISEDK